MELTPNAINQIKLDVSAAMESGAVGLTPAAIPIDLICKNKELILAFLQTLVALLPGVLGKVAGQVVIAAAETWFSRKCVK